MITSEKIREFLQSELTIDTSDIEDESPLFSSGIVDSFALVSLMTFLEDEGGIRVNASEVNLDNMDSISRITRYVREKS